MATIEVNDDLLKQAQDVTGERDAAEAVHRALSEIVRIDELRKNIRKLRANSDLFWRDYLEDIRPNAYELREDPTTSDVTRRAVGGVTYRGTR